MKLKASLISLFVIAIAITSASEAFAMKWKGLRQSDNLIDYREQTRLLAPFRDMHIAFNDLKKMFLQIDRYPPGSLCAIYQGENFLRMRQSVEEAKSEEGLKKVCRIQPADISTNASDPCAISPPPPSSPGESSPGAAPEEARRPFNAVELALLNQELEASLAPLATMVESSAADLKASLTNSTESPVCQQTLRDISKKMEDFVGAEKLLRKRIQNYLDRAVR